MSAIGCGHRLFAYSDAEGYEGTFRAALAAIGAGGKTIGLDGSAMRFFEYEVIRRYAPGADLVDASEALVALRLHKSEGEIAAIRRAIAISEGALEAMLAEVRVGMSERELGSILDSNMIRLGGQGVAFETLLHAGGNTALPHTGPLAYRIQHGDPLLVDFGARFNGYCADITRTFFVGAVSAAQRDFYAVVEAANAAGRATAGPGVSQKRSISRRGRSSLMRVTRACCATGRGMVWACWRMKRRILSAAIGRCWKRAWSSPLSRASIAWARSVCGSKTMC